MVLTGQGFFIGTSIAEGALEGGCVVGRTGNNARAKRPGERSVLDVLVQGDGDQKIGVAPKGTGGTAFAVQTGTSPMGAVQNCNTGCCVSAAYRSRRWNCSFVCLKGGVPAATVVLNTPRGPVNRRRAPLRARYDIKLFLGC